MKHVYLFLLICGLLSCENTEDKHTSTTATKPQTDSTVTGSEEAVVTSAKTYALGNIKVELTQEKSEGEAFYCKAKLVTSKDDEIIDSIVFSPEPVGGNYGIAKPQRIENHLLFTKHGDYDGRTISVNGEGQIASIIGGKNYVDTAAKLLFTLYESDLGGFAVFDLYADSLLLEMVEIEDYPVSFHKAFGNRYFMRCTNDEFQEPDYAIWEIELDLGRIEQVDLDSSQMNTLNMLTFWPIEDANCTCEI